MKSKYDIMQPITNNDDYKEACEFLRCCEAKIIGLQGLVDAVKSLVAQYESKEFKLKSHDHSDVLDFLREQFGLSYTEIAKVLGCSKSAISEIKNNGREFSKKQIKILNAKFNIPYESFLGDSQTSE